MRDVRDVRDVREARAVDFDFNYINYMIHVRF